MNNQIILAVDDNPASLKLIQWLLVEQGYIVRTAESAQNALELLQSFTPDGVLMDIRMPGINGLQLTRLLRLGQRTRPIPILAVSSYATPKKIREAFLAGCSGYVAKPIDTGTFPGVLQEVLRRASGKQKKRSSLSPEERALPVPRWDYRANGRPASGLSGDVNEPTKRITGYSHPMKVQEDLTVGDGECVFRLDWLASLRARSRPGRGNPIPESPISGDEYPSD